MTNQEILDNAPEGATHFDGTYYRYEGYEHGQAYLVLKNGSWAHFQCLSGFQDYLRRLTHQDLQCGSLGIYLRRGAPRGCQ